MLLHDSVQRGVTVVCMLSFQVAPLLIVGETSLIGISTLLSSTNFYTRLLRLRDKSTNTPIFTVLSVELACAACKENGKSAECVHMLHLIPRSHPHFHLTTGGTPSLVRIVAPRYTVPHLLLFFSS